MANAKKTQKEYFEELISIFEEMGKQEYVDFCQGRIDVLNNKSKSKKPTKTQQENEVLKGEVLAVLTNEGATVSEIIAKSDALNGMSTQKVTPLLKTLINEGVAKKEMDKKRALFSLV